MDLTIVGSGTASPHPRRAGSCFHLAVGGTRLLFDCGPAAVHHLARFDLAWHALTHVVLSHFHADHVADLPTLFFAMRHAPPEPRTRPLHLLGPPGTRAFLERLAGAHGEYMRDPGCGLEIVELGGGDGADLENGLRLDAFRTRHTDASLAFRIEAGGRSVGYTSDTGPDAGLAAFLRRVDVLLAECSLPDDLVGDNHLSPATLADLAGAAAPGLLVVSHVYPALEPMDLPGLLRSAGWGGPLIRAEDGLRLRV